jgi:hypothetical protein
MFACLPFVNGLDNLVGIAWRLDDGVGPDETSGNLLSVGILDQFPCVTVLAKPPQVTHPDVGVSALNADGHYPGKIKQVPAASGVTEEYAHFHSQVFRLHEMLLGLHHPLTDHEGGGTPQPGGFLQFLRGDGGVNAGSKKYSGHGEVPHPLLIWNILRHQVLNRTCVESSHGQSITFSMGKTLGLMVHFGDGGLQVSGILASSGRVMECGCFQTLRFGDKPRLLST